MATGGQDGKVVIWDLVAPREGTRLAATEMVDDTTGARSVDASEERQTAPGGRSAGDGDSSCPDEEDADDEGGAREGGGADESSGGGGAYAAAVDGVGRREAVRAMGWTGSSDDRSAGRRSLDPGLGGGGDGRELSFSGSEVRPRPSIKVAE